MSALDDYSTGDVVNMAVLMAAQGRRRHAALQIEDALATLREVQESEGVPDSVHAAIGALAEASPSSWLDFAISRRLAQEGLRF